jgi:uncharacterized protein DUF1360
MDTAADKPMVSYAILMATWGGSFAGFLAAWSRRRGLPDSVPLRDVLLVGIATHKLSRTITRDRVTAPVRAPFTKIAGPGPHGEVTEKARGRGLRRAIGDLLTCPYCTGPWVAGALVCGLVAAPRTTRLVASVFSAVALSDFLHLAYQAASDRAKAQGAAPQLDGTPISSSGNDGRLVNR